MYKPVPALKNQQITYLRSRKTKRKMKQIFTTIVLFWLLQPAQSQNYFACGEQAGLWNYDTVFVQCDVQIPDGQVLQIAPGTKVIFNGHFSLHVQGTLKALGQSADSILFTINDTTGFGNIHSNSGGWNGIRFEDTPESNDSSQFSFCRLSFGKAVGDSANCYGGALRIKRFNKISIRSCRLDDNYSFLSGGALYAFKSNLIIENSIVSGNYSGNDGMVYGYGGGLCFVSSDPIVRKNLFYNNSSTGVGGAASFEFSRPILLDCVVRDNYSALGGGLCFLRSQPDRTVANLLIINNIARFFGGGIANLTATTVMSNATITGNMAPMGGGYYCNEYAHAKLFNSILWGNIASDTLGSQVWIWDVNSVPGFYNTIVEGGIPWFGGSTFQGEFVDCPNLDPLFTAAASGDYSLQAGSPAINTALNDIGFFALPNHDLAGQNRLMHGTVDMGAYEYQGFVGINQKKSGLSEISITPNPVTENSTLSIRSAAQQPCSIRITDMQGKSCFETTVQLLEGQNTISLAGFVMQNQLPKGLYLLNIQAESIRASIKLLR